MGSIKVKGSTASIIEFIFGALCIIGGFSAFRVNVLTGIAWILFGCFLLATGIQWRLLISEYRRYSTLIGNRPSIGIDALARSTNQSESTVIDNLRLMIKKRMANDVAIDEHSRSLIQGSPRAASAESIETSQPPEQMTITVECKGCGARNEIVKGRVGECEHCGARISA